MNPRQSPIVLTLLRRLPILAAAGIVLLALTPGRAAIAEPQAPPLHAEGLLWRIDTPGSAPSYLFGTIHLTDRRVTALPHPVVKALDSAASLTGELILGAETERAVAQRVRLAEGRDLEDILGGELYAKVLARTREVGIVDGLLRRLEPWAAMSMLIVPLDELARISIGQLTVDETLQQMARERGIPVHGLESVAEQLNAFGGLAEADLIEIIRGLVDRQHLLLAYTEELIGDYLDRDLRAIHAHGIEIIAGYDPDRVDRYTDWVVDRRSLRMVDRMAGVLADGNAFIAVGAAHLPGETGLLNLLEQRGYGITRIY